MTNAALRSGWSEGGGWRVVLGDVLSEQHVVELRGRARVFIYTDINTPSFTRTGRVYSSNVGGDAENVTTSCAHCVYAGCTHTPFGWWCAPARWGAAAPLGRIEPLSRLSLSLPLPPCLSLPPSLPPPSLPPRGGCGGGGGGACERRGPAARSQQLMPARAAAARAPCHALRRSSKHFYFRRFCDIFFSPRSCVDRAVFLPDED